LHNIRWQYRMFIIVLLVILSGCFPTHRRYNEGQLFACEGVVSVQAAVEQYQKKTGLLPLMNSDVSVFRYEKFRINFQLLRQHRLLDTIPSHAFESGGTNLFLIINEETKPTVRMMDLRIAQRVNDLIYAIRRYVRTKGKGSLPLQKSLYPNFYQIDEAAIGIQHIDVKSPFSQRSLSFMMDKTGKVYADYAPDIMEFIHQTSALSLAQLPDLRTVLVENSCYVPVKSVPYVWKQNAPCPQLE